jgi:type II secretory pathway component PulJ
MWGGLFTGILARPWARRAAGLALVALTITLFTVNLRRTAEHAGRAAERFEQLERTHATQRQMLDAAARRPRSRDDLLDRLRGGGF